MQCSRRRKPGNGFTLIEIIIASAIFLIVLATVAVVIKSSLDALKDLQVSSALQKDGIDVLRKISRDFRCSMAISSPAPNQTITLMPGNGVEISMTIPCAGSTGTDHVTYKINSEGELIRELNSLDPTLAGENVESIVTTLRSSSVEGIERFILETSYMLTKDVGGIKGHGRRLKTITFSDMSYQRSISTPTGTAVLNVAATVKVSPIDGDTPTQYINITIAPTSATTSPPFPPLPTNN